MIFEPKGLSRMHEDTLGFSSFKTQTQNYLKFKGVSLPPPHPGKCTVSFMMDLTLHIHVEYQCQTHSYSILFCSLFVSTHECH